MILRSLSIFTLQILSVPDVVIEVQSCQFSNNDTPGVILAVSCTWSPSLYVPVQAVPQLIALFGVVEITVPAPFTIEDTVTVRVLFSCSAEQSP
jgi:hypothetical protein